MKKLLIITLLTLGLNACDGPIDTSSFPLQTPLHEYEIDTWGANSEVYEIIPKSAPDYRCVMLMLDSGRAVGFDCFPVTQQTEVSNEYK